MMRSPPAPSLSAKDTNNRAALLGSVATVGLLSVLPSLQRSSPGTGQLTDALNVATVTGKPAAAVKPFTQEEKRLRRMLLPLMLTT